MKLNQNVLPTFGLIYFYTYRDMENACFIRSLELHATCEIQVEMNRIPRVASSVITLASVSHIRVPIRIQYINPE